MSQWRRRFIWALVSVGVVAFQIRAVYAEKVIFAYPSPSTSFLPLVVAHKKGFFDVENLQVELVQIRPAVCYSGFTTTMAKLKGNPQQIKKVLRAGLKGLRYVQDNRPGTIDVIQSWYRVEREVAGATYDLARKSYSTNGEISEKGVLLSMEFARSSGKFEKETLPSEIVDFNLLREVRKELAGQ